MPHKILTLQQAAKHIRIPERELFHLVQRDEIPYLRRGDEVVFEHHLLDDWAQRRILGLPTQSLTDHHREATADRAKKATEDILVEQLFTPIWINPALASRTKPAVLRDMVTLAATTNLLYDDVALLRGLEERGLVQARWVKAGKVRERKQYAITTQGRVELAARKRQWRQFATAMDLVLSSRTSNG